MTKDNDFLNWLADRLVHVYGESPNVDFVHKLREIAKNTHPEQTRGNLENNRMDQPEWFSVADRLPKESVDVLVSAEYDTDIPFGYESMYVCKLFKGRWLEGTEHNTIEGVTHWRCLPDGPKVKK
jgi:hypothetical protein